MSDINGLIQRWQDGDERAAEALYERYEQPTFRLAYGLLGDPAEAEEAALDALAYALIHIASYNPSRGSFPTWLHTITVSRCRDRQRHRRLFTYSLSAWLQAGGDAPDPTPSPEHSTSRAETSSEVWQAVQRLKPPLREALLLRYWADHTYEEMATILGCPLRTAQSRVRLAYGQLRAVLAPAEFASFEIEETP